MNILSWYVANITSLALVIFWDVFILEESHNCDDELECFYKNHTYINLDCSGVTSAKINMAHYAMTSPWSSLRL